MNETQQLKLDKVVGVLYRAAERGCTAVMSFLKDGKWQISNVKIIEVSDNDIKIDIENKDNAPLPQLPINQPVGMSFKVDYTKYIFESHISSTDGDANTYDQSAYAISLPDRMESMQRRAYSRVSLPPNMKVNVTIWHRGYKDQALEAPKENYWQGNLVDLSAGGMLISVKSDLSKYLSPSQYVGLQFTPMSYQKPILLEGTINRINGDEDRLGIAIEFRGLEASQEGRDKLHRLISTVKTYKMQNKGLGTKVNDNTVAADEALRSAEDNTSQLNAEMYQESTLGPIERE